MKSINRVYLAELAPVGSNARGAARRAEIIERRIEAHTAAAANVQALALAAKLSTDRGIAFGVLDVYGVYGV